MGTRLEIASYGLTVLAEEPMREPVAFSYKLIEIVGRLGLQVRRHGLRGGLDGPAQEAAFSRMVSFCERWVSKSPVGRDGFLRCVRHQTHLSACSHSWTIDMTSP
jgi:hypothetical protein